MDIITRITLPAHIYDFYAQASHHITDCRPEKVMADTLALYAGMVSKDVAEQNEKMLQQSTTADMTENEQK